MNPLDAIIVIIVLVSMGAGVRRGFIVGVYDMLVAIASLAFAAVAYNRAAELIGGFLDLSEPSLNLAGFVAAFAVLAVPGTLLLRPVVRRFRSLTGIVPGVNPIDRSLGIIPGAVQGVVVAFVFVLACGFFATSSQLGGWLTDSTFGLRLYRSGTSAVLETAGNAGFEPSEFFSFTRQAQSGSHVLPFREDPATLAISVDDEAAMLALVNEERSAAGLSVLVPDAELSAVARLHGIEMFKEGYFSHQSPTTGSPFDRLDAHGIHYLMAGENLALAPHVEQAHDGLMNSPGHRANILEPGYRRVGIGAVESELHGTMYVQMFAN